MFINFISLTQWNANWCYLLRTTFPVFVAFKFFFQQLCSFLQLQSCFIKWYDKEWRMKSHNHNGSWHKNFEFTSCKWLQIFYILWCLTWNNRKPIELLRVCSMDKKSSLTLLTIWNFGESHKSKLTFTVSCSALFVTYVHVHYISKVALI